MAGATLVQTKGKGRKALDVDLNLVPFIDLLSCLISFLLISAVWTKVSAIPASAAMGHEGPARPSEPVQVMVTTAGYAVSAGGEPVLIAKSSRHGRLRYDGEKLVGHLRAIRGSGDEHAVTIGSDDAVDYEDFADAMDRVASAWLPRTAEITIR